jgi:4-hydroxybenzoyl-CoA thioesterase/acyl-CoA thioester hydrolase
MPYAHLRRVEFRDTDAAGIVHFSVFFPMMEEAEHAALRYLGLSVLHPIGDETHLTWPRVSATCDFFAPARFEDQLRIDVSVSKIGTSSVTYGFAFQREFAAQPSVESAGVLIARGSVTAVCCLLSPGQPLRKQPIPADIREKLVRLADPIS